MGKHFFVNEDEEFNENNSWTSNSHIFKAIFGRIASIFKSHEKAQKEECYYDWGIDGIDLCEVQKESFNIFYIRAKEALSNYPDDKEWEFQAKNPENKGTHEYIISEWKNILVMLEKDKRYDAKWIADYQNKI